MLDERGEDVAELVTASTIDYYGELLALTLEADEQTLRGRRLIDRMTILLLRHRFPAPELHALDGRGLLVLGVEEGMVGTEDVVAADLGEVEVSGDTAVAEAITAEGAGPGLNWEFRREGGRWRIDLTAPLPIANLALEQAAAESGLPEDDFVFRLIEATTGTQVQEDIWDPPSR